MPNVAWTTLGWVPGPVSSSATMRSGRASARREATAQPAGPAMARFIGPNSELEASTPAMFSMRHWNWSTLAATGYEPHSPGGVRTMTAKTSGLVE